MTDHLPKDRPSAYVEARSKACSPNFELELELDSTLLFCLLDETILGCSLGMHKW
jgi:hypothetical protein